MSCSEIARELGVTQQTVSETLGKALRKARREFSRRGISQDYFDAVFDHHDCRVE